MAVVSYGIVFSSNNHSALQVNRGVQHDVYGTKDGNSVMHLYFAIDDVAKKSIRIYRLQTPYKIKVFVTKQ